eukprot:TRINITY_DN111477_c0_g1_i1.p1 TRINITY_DN111477_c0_g1~~TRINITY_DN111477_c0_g1_i1.p1  ORF type:complete len:323 (+),score=66.49 TRINITY_DN111477_c0_g1_i1:206-1174(+)
MFGLGGAGLGGGGRPSNDPFLSHAAPPQRQTQTQPQFARYGASAAPARKLPVASGPSVLSIIVALLCSQALAIFIITSLTYAMFWQATSIPVLVTMIGLAVSVAGQSGAGGLLTVVTGLIGLSSGAVTGIYTHEAYIGPFLKIVHGREYTDVLASAPAAAYADAGKIIFADTSQVDTMRSVGYRDRRTYCVAPVVDSGSAQDRTINFWAVGLDCCNARGDFECGAADLYGSRGGIRLSAQGLLENQYEDFKQAINQAAAVYDLGVEDDPIMVRWVENPAVEQVKMLMSALGTLILGTVSFVGLVISAAATSSLMAAGDGLPR